MGGSWGADGTILFAADYGRAIFRIPASGGEVLLRPAHA